MQLKFLEYNRPRWLIFLIDIGICFFSLGLAYILRWNFADIPQSEINSFSIVFPCVLGIRAISFYFSKIYKGIIRYTSSKDIVRIFTVVSLGSIVFCVVNGVTAITLGGRFIIPFSIIIIEYMATTFLLISLRMSYRTIYMEVNKSKKDKRCIIIYGAGEEGVVAKRTLDRDEGTKYDVLAFIDDEPKMKGRKIENISIYNFSKLKELLENNSVAHVIIAAPNLAVARKQELVELCLPYKTKVLNVPAPGKWINGELSFKQIKKVRIEELLERDPIKLDQDLIEKQIKNKVVLVTGAAGSIGSELCRQIMKYHPKKLVVLDNAESGLYDIELELAEIQGESGFEIVMGDIRNENRMENVFKTFRPQIVYHAAAYKHVPMMENNPSEALLTNVHGTKITADLAVKYNAERFVMVSTDKAVNPTNVMGASKRIAEIYTQALGNNKQTTKFITTRFGNVLGSAGSVIPRFYQQIEKGGPVTITHPEINRFFMTIPEACQLVLEAGCIGNGGEIFIFDMGKSVKIVDLATKMIQLSGLELGKDIQIVYTGLRPGEKLYEELLSNGENTLPTHHPQILKAKVQEYNYSEISKSIDELILLFPSQENNAIVGLMKVIVPEYVSNNSVFEKLDAGNK